ncbi:MAG: hypothetical protein WCK63_01545 [Betaproteobacteria bacterium]
MAMTDRTYCYHCRSYHPAHVMTQVPTAGGKRWRCLKSFSYGQTSQAQRDAFGKKVSELNRASSASLSRARLPRPVLEVIRSASGGR